MNLLTPPVKSGQLLAILECVMFTLIAGSTLVLSKKALSYLGPLTVVSLRYTLAFFLLFPFVFRHGSLSRFSPRLWFRFFLIGLSFYAIGNGTLFWGLKYIPAVTASLLLSFVPVLILVAGIIWLDEIPTWTQVLGVVVAAIGSALFFSTGLKVGEPLGIAIVIIGLAGNAAFGVLSREIAREQDVDTLTLTAIPLGFGSGVLIPIAFSIEGWPRASVTAWGIVLVLAVIHTVFAFVLYNHALRTLPAFEVSAMLNLTPLVTALWAWLFLSESLNPVQIAGMIVIGVGILLVQIDFSKIGRF